MLQRCTFSHWDLQGLKPYMRYSPQGGYHPNAENIYTANECGLADTDRQTNLPPMNMVQRAMDAWMASPSHREAILNPAHTNVSLGLAWDRHTYKAVQHFESQYLIMDRPPSIRDNTIHARGALISSLSFASPELLAALIIYDQPPRPLTKGQLARTSCYQHGPIIAAVMPPEWNPGLMDSYTVATSLQACNDPNNTPPQAPTPGSIDQSKQLWDQAKAAAAVTKLESLDIPIILSQDITIQDNQFHFSANLEQLLKKHGPGVYTIKLIANISQAGSITRAPPPNIPETIPQIIAQHSIFHPARPQIHLEATFAS